MKSDKFLKINKAEKNRKNMAMCIVSNISRAKMSGKLIKEPR